MCPSPPTRSCIKLLKPWTGEESPSESESEGGEEGQAGGPPLGRQVAELTLDRQLLRELVAAGGRRSLHAGPAAWWQSLPFE